ncbi:MAG: hypothetical protein JJT77_10135 [Crocinitomicaceae bacterium]|nr:hypothetical protein [Crocinitomicaceae bacterium]
MRVIIAVFLFSYSGFGQGIKISESGTTPEASAILELESSNKGFLPTRMSTTERDLILSPSDGLLIYNTTTNCLQWWNGSVWFDACGNNPPTFPAGTVFCDAGSTIVEEVISPGTGKVWMDRNLGASQAATSSTDAAAYGDLYQWGRRSDGHQCRTSITTTTIS